MSDTVHLDGGPGRTLCGIPTHHRRSGVLRRGGPTSRPFVVADLADGVSCGRCRRVAAAPDRVYCVECGMTRARRARLPREAPTYCSFRCGYRSAVRLFRIAAALDDPDRCYLCGSAADLARGPVFGHVGAQGMLACADTKSCARRCHANATARVVQKHLPDIAPGGGRA